MSDNPPTKPELVPKTVPNKWQPLSNKKSQQAPKRTEIPIKVPKHRYNTRNRIYSTPIILDNYVALFAMCTQTSPSTTVALSPFFDYAVIDPDTDYSLEYRHIMKVLKKEYWTASTNNLIGRLSQGVLPYMRYGTDTMFFIKHTDITQGRTTTYLHSIFEEKY